MNRFLAIPIRRDLENGRTADTAMGEQHIFEKGGPHVSFRAGNGRDDFDRDSGKIAPAFAVAFDEGEWNQGCAGGLDVQSELSGQIITERSGTDFCNGQAAGRDYQPGHAETGVVGLDDELVFIRNISIRNLSIRNFSLKNAGHFGVAPDLYSGIAAFLLQHCGDVARRTIAE